MVSLPMSVSRTNDYASAALSFRERARLEWQFPLWRLARPLERAALTRALNRSREMLGIGDALLRNTKSTGARAWKCAGSICSGISSQHAHVLRCDNVQTSTRIWNDGRMAIRCQCVSLLAGSADNS